MFAHFLIPLSLTRELIFFSHPAAALLFYLERNVSGLAADVIRLMLMLLHRLRLRGSSLDGLRCRGPMNLLLSRCRSVLSMLHLNVLLLRRNLAFLLSYLCLLNLFRFHPNIHGQLLEPMFQCRRVVVLIKGFG